MAVTATVVCDIFFVLLRRIRGVGGFVKLVRKDANRKALEGRMGCKTEREVIAAKAMLFRL